MKRRTLAAWVVVSSVAITGAATTVRAATLHLTTVYSGSFDAGLNDLGMPLLLPNPVVAPSDTHKFDVFFEIEGAAANENLQFLQFDALLGPGFSPVSPGSWMPNNPPSPVGPSPLYSTNADSGGNANDLVQIAVIANGPQGVTALRPGIGSPSKLGVFRVHWNGTPNPGGPAISLAPNGSTPWVTYVGVGAVPHAASTVFVENDFYITTSNVPQLDVFGNSEQIFDNDAMPSLLDGTDFGDVLPASIQQRTFSIENPGDEDLQLQSPLFLGPYSLVGDFPTVLGDGKSVEFTVALDTTLGRGTYPGSISFATNLTTIPNFNFALTGRVIPEPTCSSLVVIVLLVGARCRYIKR